MQELLLVVVTCRYNIIWDIKCIALQIHCSKPENQICYCVEFFNLRPQVLEPRNLLLHGLKCSQHHRGCHSHGEGGEGKEEVLESERGGLGDAEILVPGRSVARWQNLILPFLGLRND